MLIGAVNAFNQQTNSVLDLQTGHYIKVLELARKCKAEHLGSIVLQKKIMEKDHRENMRNGT